MRMLPDETVGGNETLGARLCFVLMALLYGVEFLYWVEDRGGSLMFPE